MRMSMGRAVNVLAKLAVAGLTAWAAMATAQTPAADTTNAIEKVDATLTSTGVVLTIDMKNPVTAAPASMPMPFPACCASWRSSVLARSIS